MIHHIKTAFRYLNRNRVATAINVSGLAIAMAAAFLMLQYLDFELSYDTCLPEHKNVYRIATKTDAIHTSETYYGVGDWIGGTFAEVKDVTRFYRWPANTGVVFEHEGKLYHERNYLFVDKGFFNVFPSMLISGNANALNEPNTVVISEGLAMRAFGTTDVVGKTITNPEEKDKVETITGVIRNLPANSQFDVDIMRPEQWIPDAEWQWKSTVWTYVRLDDETDIAQFESKLNSALAPMLKEPATVSLQPLASIHLQSNLQSEIKTPGSMLYIYVVGGALVLILVIAWINYVNLETARFLRRLKDVGIRRIIGSTKRHLFARFFTEYLVVTSISIALAAAIVWTVFPWFGFITGLPLTTASFSMPPLWFGAAIFIVVAMIIAGAYPFLSVLQVNPIAFLKGQFVVRGTLARRSLLTFQFASSLTLMALVVMAAFQLNFMREANKSFDTNSIVTVYNAANYTWRENSKRKENNEAFRNRIAQVASVTQMTTSSAIPGEPIGFTYTDLAKRSMSDPDRQIHYKVMYVDYDFIPMFGLELIAGRNYSPEFAHEWDIVVTESAVRDLGFNSAEEAVGEKIYFNEPDDWHQWNIIGVVKDYRHQSIKSVVHPAILRLNVKTGQFVYYSFKISHTDAVATIETAWKETWPGKPFEYFFLDEHYDQQYKSEIHFSRVFMLFSGVAVFVACLGIMGMSLFEANARMKEIGIRKVMGAEVRNIVVLLTKDSLRILLIAFAMALPVVYLLASKWLSTYPEHIEFSAWFMVGPLVVLIFLGSAVSLTQVVKAALRNPVDSLKHE